MFSHFHINMNSTFTMFSWGRRFQLSLRHSIRPFGSQSQASTSSSSSSSFSSFGGSRHGDNRVRDFEAFLRSITSGVVVVSSTLGYWYWSSLSSPGANSLQSFADGYANEEDQFQQNDENKPKFLFNGTLLFSHHLYVACSLLYYIYCDFSVCVCVLISICNANCWMFSS